MAEATSFLPEPVLSSCSATETAAARDDLIRVLSGTSFGSDGSSGWTTSLQPSGSNSGSFHIGRHDDHLFAVPEASVATNDETNKLFVDAVLPLHEARVKRELSEGRQVCCFLRQRNAFVRVRSDVDAVDCKGTLNEVGTQVVFLKAADGRLLRRLPVPGDEVLLYFPTQRQVLGGVLQLSCFVCPRHTLKACGFDPHGTCASCSSSHTSNSVAGCKCSTQSRGVRQGLRWRVEAIDPPEVKPRRAADSSTTTDLVQKLSTSRGACDATTAANTPATLSVFGRRNSCSDSSCTGSTAAEGPGARYLSFRNSASGKLLCGMHGGSTVNMSNSKGKPRFLFVTGLGDPQTRDWPQARASTIVHSPLGPPDVLSAPVT